MFTCRDSKGGMLSSQASQMLYKPPGAVYMDQSTNQIAGNSLFSSEIILKINNVLMDFD